MTLVAIVTSGCIIKNFKCWQLGSIAWNTGTRAGKRQLERRVPRNERAERSLLCQDWLGNNGGNQWHGYIKWLFCLPPGSLKQRGEKTGLHPSYSSLFLVRKKGTVPIWNWLLMVSFCALGRFEVHVAGWGTTAGLPGNGGVWRNLVILMPSLFALVLLCWFWLLMRYILH